MARIKAKWHRSQRPRTAEENGSVIASVSYKAARLAIQRLLGADFDLISDRRRFAILAELLAFQVQMADRLAYLQLDEVTRRGLINGTGKHLARIYAENLAELGTAEDTPAARAEFIGLLNECLHEYAELHFDADGRPGYSVLRYLGTRLCELAEPRDKRWLIEQTVDIESLKLVENLLRAWHMLYPPAAAGVPETTNPGS
jgi:hypothetical protein